MAHRTDVERVVGWPVEERPSTLESKLPGKADSRTSRAFEAVIVWLAV